MEFGGKVIAETTRCVRVLGKGSPPDYYFPPEDVRMEYLVPSERTTWCEWKGTASYWSVRVGDRIGEDVAWSYLEPTQGFEAIRGYIAFYAAKVDACYIERGGLAGRDPTMILPLKQAQSVFKRPDRVNLIIVSNRGGVVSGEKLSEEVSRTLRVLFADRTVAAQLKVLLNQGPVLQALEETEESLSGDILKDFSKLRSELGRAALSDELISLLADNDVSREVLDTLDQDELKEVEARAITLFQDLNEFHVLDIIPNPPMDRDGRREDSGSG